jgi:hypothetical protein
MSIVAYQTFKKKKKSLDAYDFRMYVLSKKN